VIGGVQASAGNQADVFAAASKLMFRQTGPRRFSKCWRHIRLAAIHNETAATPQAKFAAAAGTGGGDGGLRLAGAAKAENSGPPARSFLVCILARFIARILACAATAVATKDNQYAPIDWP
jgi:hypothetical protein